MTSPATSPMVSPTESPSMSPIQRSPSRAESSNSEAGSIVSLRRSLSRALPLNKLQTALRPRRHTFDPSQTEPYEHQIATLTQAPPTPHKKAPTRRSTLGGDRNPPSYKTVPPVTNMRPLLEEHEFIDEDNMAWGKPTSPW
ncbi:hypothetical protein SISSUDRAFT_518418 [Sistotremastrum suecicum HHB10207 ss-3]|uniref:Uncharacterized protein n=1 Tax=Sistotremastrum suecicum HHB10207 ss-3 TaxID=1314776 RepID=A0A166F9L4_9AGAM|nr:hypothetical protein SISSUDRAFT_518418 [Sistotremastrum suecicum HHB10207 ss-3]